MIPSLSRFCVPRLNRDPVPEQLEYLHTRILSLPLLYLLSLTVNLTLTIYKYLSNWEKPSATFNAWQGRPVNWSSDYIQSKRPKIMSIADELEKLANLRNLGTLDEDEFLLAKAKILTEQIADATQVTSERKLYSKSGVLIATVFGGFAGTGLAVGRNFWRTGRTKEGWLWFSGFAIGANFLIISVILLIPGGAEIPGLLWWTIQSCVAKVIYDHFIAENMRLHLIDGGLIETKWKAALAGLCGLLFGVLIIFAVVILLSFCGWMPSN